MFASNVDRLLVILVPSVGARLDANRDAGHGSTPVIGCPGNGRHKGSPRLQEDRLRRH
jgi:hypothetical protein